MKKQYNIILTVLLVLALFTTPAAADDVAVFIWWVDAPGSTTLTVEAGTNVLFEAEADTTNPPLDIDVVLLEGTTIIQTFADINSYSDFFYDHLFTINTDDLEGTYTVQITATTSTDVDQEEITLVVTPLNSPPVLDPISDKEIEADQTLEFQVTATDEDGDTLTYEVEPTEPGMSFDEDTGEFSWTPTEPGTYTITITVDDGNGGTDEETITITVLEPSDENHPPTFDLSPDADSILFALLPFPVFERPVNELLAIDVIGIDADNDPLEFSVDSIITKLPPGVQFTDLGEGSDNALIYGTPTAAGIYPLFITVTDGKDSFSYGVILKIEEKQSPIINGGDPLDDITINEGETAVLSITAEDEDSDSVTLSAYTYSCISGTNTCLHLPLPTDVLFIDNNDGTGQFTFAPDYTYVQHPDTKKSTTLIVYAEDETHKVKQTFDYTVLDVNQLPEFTSGDYYEIPVGTLLQFDVDVTDADAEDTVKVVWEEPLPTGASFNTPEFTWTPTSDQIGTHEVTFVATDEIDVATQDVTIVVLATACSDGIDNDGDTLVDMDDPGCDSPEDDNEFNDLLPQCSDNLDNDFDGHIDEEDFGCYEETGNYNPFDNDESDDISFECSDGIDNDGDGLVDIDDPGCNEEGGFYDPLDNDEFNPLPPSFEITGIKCEDTNRDGICEITSVTGAPTILYVIDTSSSTISPFAGDPVPDMNGDGAVNTVLDAEIAAYIALTEHIVAEGFGDSATIAIISFNDFATEVDTQPGTAGIQITSLAGDDTDGNGELDIVEALGTLASGGSTDYEAALQKALEIYGSESLESENSNLIFLSDGAPLNFNYFDEAIELQSKINNVRAFGVGATATLGPLQDIDPAAQIFENSNKLIDFFGLGGSVILGDDILLEGITIYIDENNNEMLDADEYFTITDSNGAFLFPDLGPGTYIVREIIPEGYIQMAPSDGFFEVTLPVTSPTNLEFANAVAYCSDGVDNDADGFIDFPADAGCESPEDDNETNIVVEVAECSDDIDNDGDGLNNAADPGCYDEEGNYDPLDDDESDATTQCQDGIDNDGDGFVDFPDDFSCDSPQDDDEELPAAQCQDGIDNDGDGNIDELDEGCLDEDGNYNAQDNDESDEPVIILNQCEDGLDNDADWLIDFPNDPGCESSHDDDESDDPVINEDPTIEPIKPQTVNEGELLEIDFTIDDPEDDLLIVEVASPDSITMNLESIAGNAVNLIDNGDNTYTIQLKPLFTFVQHPSLEEGFTLVIAVMDNAGNRVQEEFEVTVFDVNQIPQFVSETAYSVSLGDTLTFTIEAIDGDSEDILKYDFNLPLPTGATTHNQEFTWAPAVDQIGTHNLRVSVTDSIINTPILEDIIIVVGATVCSDNLDNDNDGLTDAKDPGCYDESGNYNPLDNNEGDTTTACQDGIDNDFDGFLDLEDPGCENPFDNDEFHIIKKPKKGIEIVYAHPTPEVVYPGESTTIVTRVENNGNVDLKDVRFTVFIYDLEYYYSTGEFNLDDGEGETRVIPLQIPDYAPSGDYVIKVTAKNSQIHETAHRIITVQ